MVLDIHIGQSFGDFLCEKGIYEEVQFNALKKDLAQQIKSMMDEKGIRKSEMARRMKTSRSSLDRLFNEDLCTFIYEACFTRTGFLLATIMYC